MMGLRQRTATSETSSRWNAALRLIPDLYGAPSTRYYRECEEHLFRRYFGDLAGKRLLKIDLWNEARNTRILVWAAQNGAEVYGVDIAAEVAREARQTFLQDSCRAGLVVGDVHCLPFGDGVFDAVYSMGTIEHSPDHEVALSEIFRILRPHGTAIIGVPNKLDPFFRPLMVSLLDRLGLYAYGPEKAFTPRALRRLVASAGFRTTEETGILLLPGWLRMLDLFLHTRFPPLAALTACLVYPFAWLYRRFPFVRRHGYLIACVGRKPAATPRE